MFLLASLCCLLTFLFSDGIGAFVIGLSVISSFSFLWKFLSFMMSNNYVSETAVECTASYFVKIIWCSRWFCKPSPLFEAVSCFICGCPRVAATRYRMIVLAVSNNCIYNQEKWFHVKNIVAAFRGMHVSPAKHSFGKCDRKVWQTDGQTDGRDVGQSDPYVSLYFAGDTKTKVGVLIGETICF